MKTKIKKYPILITTIISCLIVIVSLFILGFFGIKLGVSLGGGTQIEVVMSDSSQKSTYVSNIETILNKYGYSIDSLFVEDKYVGAEENAEFTRKCLVIQVSDEIDEDTITLIKSDVASTLSLSESSITIDDITSSIVSKNALYLGLAFIIIAVCFFIFGWIRYDIFAGISFVIAILHNIILYLSVVILTRIELSVSSLSILIFLTLLMCLVLVGVYEKFRLDSKVPDADKTPIQERMIKSEKDAVKPFIILLVAVVIIMIGLLFIPALRVRVIAGNMLLAVIVTIYTSLLIGPSAYVAMLEIREMNRKAILSRNDTINKQIKKKIKKNNAKNKNEEVSSIGENNNNTSLPENKIDEK